MDFDLLHVVGMTLGDDARRLLGGVLLGFLPTFVIALVVLVLLSRFLKHPHDEPDSDSLSSRLASYCTFSTVLVWLILVALTVLYNREPFHLSLGDLVQDAALMGVGAFLAGLLLYWSRLRYAQRQRKGTSAE